MTLHSRTRTATTEVAAPRTPWSVLALVAVPQFMVILDMTVTYMALPSIGRALHLSLSGLQWVVTAYVLVTGGLTLLGGRTSDLLGRRATFLTGLTIFTLASLTSGLAPDAAMLIASRAAQGLGAAMLTPSALAIVTASYTGSQRATALGIWGAMAGGGAAAGVLIGGAITTWIGWRWVFLINVPVGILVAAIAPRRLIASRGRGGFRQLDAAGAVLAIGGLMSLVYAITGAHQYRWVLLVVAIALLAGFAAVERTAANPLIPRGALRSRSLVSGVVVMLSATSIMVGVFYLGSLFLQTALHASPVLAGAEFLPLLAMVGLGTHVASRLAAARGTRPLAVAGLLIMAAGALWLSRATGYPTGILPGFVLLGAGIGLVFPAASITAMSTIEAERAGLASGLLTTGHEVGGAFGVAVFTAITAGDGTLVDGYRLSLTVAAAIAAVLAVLVTVALPSARPAPGVKVGGH